VVVLVARTGVVRAAAHVRQHAEVIVEGVVLLHQDDDVLHFVEVAVRAGGDGAAAQRRKTSEQRHSTD